MAKVEIERSEDGGFVMRCFPADPGPTTTKVLRSFPDLAPSLATAFGESTAAAAGPAQVDASSAGTPPARSY